MSSPVRALIATLAPTLLFASLAHATVTVPAGISGILIRNHDSSSLWHQPQTGGFVGLVHVADTITFPRQEARSYAIFDLAPVVNEVSSGNLHLSFPADSFWYASFGNNSAEEGVAIYDISTNLNTITGLTTTPWGIFATSQNRAIHDDFGNGSLYGQTMVGPAQFNTTVSIALTAQAIADINSAAGTAFGIGFNGTTGRHQRATFYNARLVLYSFGEAVSAGGGVDFRLDEGDVSGDGMVDLQPRGVDHHLNAHALSGQTEDDQFSEVRRRFTFSGTSSDPSPVTLTGALDGSLFADEGTASVDAMLQIYDTVSGQILDSAHFHREIESLLTDGAINAPVDEQLRLTLDLIPGRTYEMISRLDLSASINSPDGRADALFFNTFSVELQNGAIPEPSSIALLGIAAIAIWRVRRSIDSNCP